MVASLTLLLISCGDSGGGTSSQGDSTLYSGVFNDNAVTSFSQNGGVASRMPKKAMEFIIPSVYAASGTISCLIGEDTSFQAVALGETVDIDTSCSTTIDLSIRRELLKAFVSKTMRVEMHEHGNANAQDISFPATTDVENKMTVNVMGVGNGVDSNCGAKYEFNLTSGVVRLYVDAANTVGNGINAACASGANDFVNGFEQQIQYRFKDGKVEFNMDNETTFDTAASDTGGGVSSNPSYARWCVDNNTDGTCDL